MPFPKYFSNKKLLLLIMATAFLLRFWNAGDQDIFGDEAADAFRGIGYIDYLGTNFQTQPIDWYKGQSLPWWTHLSFHDFPPMAMIVQNIFFRIFGDSILIARLPAILLGTISAYLIFLIGKRLFDERIGIFSAAIFGIGGAMVWIFRTSLLEPVLLFFILLNIYTFFNFSESAEWRKKYWWVFGLSLGLVALTKYTSVFLVPVYFTYLFLNSISRISDVQLLKDKRFYFAFLLALLLFSPVLVYNFYLFKTTGHFDLQLAYLLRQNTPEWTGLVGKIQSPFSEIKDNLLVAYGPGMILAAAAGLIYSIFRFKTKKEKSSIFIWLYVVSLTLLLVKIGSAPRFLTLYGLPFSLLAALILDFFWEKRWGKWLVVLFLLWEGFFSLQKNIINLPDYGIAKLDHYFEEEFKNKESGVIPESDNDHLNEIIYKFAQRKSPKAERELAMIVYNDDLALPTIQWIFYRRFFYHGIPTLYVDNFSRALQSNQDYSQFQFYFVQSTDKTLLNPFKAGQESGDQMESYLRERGMQPAAIIKGNNQEIMFRVYKFRISDIL